MPIVTLASMRNERTEYAKSILEFRSIFKISNMGEIAKRNRLARESTYLKIGAHTPMKPSLENLHYEIRNAMQYSREPITNHSSEYYSACGAEDAEYERKSACVDYANDLRNIARELLGRN